MSPSTGFLGFIGKVARAPRSHLSPGAEAQDFIGNRISLAGALALGASRQDWPGLLRGRIITLAPWRKVSVATACADHAADKPHLQEAA